MTQEKSRKLAKKKQELKNRVTEVEEAIREENRIMEENRDAAKKYNEARHGREEHVNELKQLKNSLAECELIKKEGTCYLLMEGKQAVNGVMAFKITKVMEQSGETKGWAVCLCVMNRGDTNVCPDDISDIQVMPLHLWKPVYPGFMKEDEEKVIERYREIGEKEFVKIMEKNVSEAYGTVPVKG